MSSSIPGAVNAFLTMMDPLQGGALPAGTQVWFGKPLPKYIAQTTLQVVEVHGDPGQEPAELGPTYRREEVYDIACILTCWTGQPDDYLGMFNQVFSVLKTVEVTVANNPTLNGNVRFAQIHTLDFVPDSDDAGHVLGSLTFTVNCQARITSLS